MRTSGERSDTPMRWSHSTAAAAARCCCGFECARRMPRPKGRSRARADTNRLRHDQDRLPSDMCAGSFQSILVLSLSPSLSVCGFARLALRPGRSMRSAIASASSTTSSVSSSRSHGTIDTHAAPAAAPHCALGGGSAIPTKTARSQVEEETQPAGTTRAPTDAPGEDGGRPGRTSAPGQIAPHTWSLGSL